MLSGHQPAETMSKPLFVADILSEVLVLIAIVDVVVKSTLIEGVKYSNPVSVAKCAKTFLGFTSSIVDRSVNGSIIVNTRCQLNVLACVERATSHSLF